MRQRDSTARRAAVALAPAVVPAVFVLLWSTGFIGARLGTPYAEPMTFLALRFLVVLVALAPLVLVLRPRWPAARQAGHVALVGLLVHGVYLGGVFVAVHQGMPVGVSALIVSLQPLLTAALVGPLLGERVGRRQVTGLLLGLAGVALVLSEKLAPAGASAIFAGFGLWAVLACLGSLLAITFGVLYQKRHCGGVDLWAGAVIQYAAALAATGALALAFESRTVVWSPAFLFALGWLALVLSLGAVSLLMLLIRHGEAARTASLFYLVPPSTAVIAFFLFDERLGPLALAGMAVAAVGVALVVAGRPPVAARR